MAIATVFYIEEDATRVKNTTPEKEPDATCRRNRYERFYEQQNHPAHEDIGQGINYF